MGTDGAATVDQAVIELSQSGVNAVFGGPAGSVGDDIDGLDGPGLRAVFTDGVVWVDSESDCGWMGVGFWRLNSGTGPVQFATGAYGASPGPPVQLRADLGLPWNCLRCGFVVAGAPSDSKRGVDVWT